MDFVSLSDAAEMLRVSRRRVQALVERGQLRAQLVGGRWLVDAQDVRQRGRETEVRGRPITQATAWKLIGEISALPSKAAARDELRRRLRPRAEHRDVSVHTSVLSKLRRSDVVRPGGRDAADQAGVPVGLLDDELDLYLRAADERRLLDDHVVRLDAARPNLHLHVLKDGTWPASLEGPVGLIVAWLDLADRGDRAERLVREHLARDAADA